MKKATSIDTFVIWSRSHATTSLIRQICLLNYIKVHGVVACFLSLCLCLSLCVCLSLTLSLSLSSTHCYCDNQQADLFQVGNNTVRKSPLVMLQAQWGLLRSVPNCHDKCAHLALIHSKSIYILAWPTLLYVQCSSSTCAWRYGTSTLQDTWSLTLPKTLLGFSHTKAYW